MTNREANKDKIREQQKAYKEANRDKIRKQQKAYKEANRDKLAEQSRIRSKVYYAKNRDKVLEQNELWRQLNNDKMKEYKRVYNHKNPDKLRKIKMCSKYNLTPDEYDILMKEASDVCPICGISFDWVDRHKANRPCIDHCHKTGRVRGIICGKCNAAIGQLNDDIVILEKAICWLSRAN